MNGRRPLNASSLPICASADIHTVGELERAPRAARNVRRLERVRGIEPLYEAWEAAVLPLNYTRVRGEFTRSHSVIGRIEGTLRGPIPRRTEGATHTKALTNRGGPASPVSVTARCVAAIAHPLGDLTASPAKARPTRCRLHCLLAERGTQTEFCSINPFFHSSANWIACFTCIVATTDRCRSSISSSLSSSTSTGVDSSACFCRIAW